VSSNLLLRLMMLTGIGLASGNPKAAVPWGSISAAQADYILPKYLPRGFQMKEPSKQKKDAVIDFLQLIIDRQDTQPPQLVFSFRKWQDSDGELMDPVALPSDIKSFMSRGQKGKSRAASVTSEDDADENADEAISPGLGGRESWDKSGSGS